jgi:transposase-like protein
MGLGNCFKGRQFTAEVILWAVRWYLMFPVSYRDLSSSESAARSRMTPN